MNKFDTRRIIVNQQSGALNRLMDISWGFSCSGAAHHSSLVDVFKVQLDKVNPSFELGLPLDGRFWSNKVQI